MDNWHKGSSSWLQDFHLWHSSATLSVSPFLNRDFAMANVSSMDPALSCMQPLFSSCHTSYIICLFYARADIQIQYRPMVNVLHVSEFIYSIFWPLAKTPTWWVTLFVNDSDTNSINNSYFNTNVLYKQFASILPKLVCNASQGKNTIYPFYCKNILLWIFLSR